MRELWKKAADEDLVVNALIHRENAENPGRLLADFTSLRVVLDHRMDPEIGPHHDAILNEVLRLARFKNLHAKLTFVPTGSKQKYPCADLHDTVMKIVEAFGADRCVWGSDFPCELWTPGISYSQHLQIFLSDIPFGNQARQKILGLTAKKLWFPELQS